MIDQWSTVKVGRTGRQRGRLIQNGDSELVLFLPGGRRERYATASIDPPGKRATLVDGEIMTWMSTCSCSQPASLKGPAARLLETLS